MAGDDARRYEDALRRLDALIDPGGGPPRGGLAAVRVRAERRLDRLRRFLREIGDPQDAYPVVHVAGTSGKGSTAVTIAAILRAAGYRVGLHTSPYLQVPTEKIQINGKLIAPLSFTEAVERTIAEAERWCRASGEPRLSYGEIWVALATRCFAEAGVEIAVIEVGAGGRFDLTNVVRPAVAVITTIGLDHQATLGDTIEAIAWHKAGIIKPGAAVVTGVRQPSARAVIAAEAVAAEVALTTVAEGETFEIVDASSGLGTTWREINEIDAESPAFTTATAGRVSAANAALALAAVRALDGRGFSATPSAAATGIRLARLPGRMEHLTTSGGVGVLLDGAHNPQKIAALMATLRDRPSDQRPVMLLGLIEGKDRGTIAELVATEAAAFVVTAPSVLGKTGADPHRLAEAIHEVGRVAPIEVAPDPNTALGAALRAATALGTDVVVTGSLYLVGALRERWFPSAAILEQRTSWPTTSRPSSE